MGLSKRKFEDENESTKRATRRTNCFVGKVNEKVTGEGEKTTTKTGTDHRTSHGESTVNAVDFLRPDGSGVIVFNAGRRSRKTGDVLFV